VREQRYEVMQKDAVFIQSVDELIASLCNQPLEKIQRLIRIGRFSEKLRKGINEFTRRSRQNALEVLPRSLLLAKHTPMKKSLRKCALEIRHSREE
jgi:phosphate uptake regulator